MKASEIFSQAINNIRKNKLRSGLTLSIIAFGIMALVGILTSIDTAIQSLGASFSGIGANSFEIKPASAGIRGRSRGMRKAPTDIITISQAKAFKDRFDFPARVSISYPGTSSATAKFGKKKSNPTTQITGIDENYLDVKGFDLAIGRNFTESEINGNYYRALIGKGIVKLLFDGDNDKAIDQSININGLKYTVIGILKSKGSSMNFSGDKNIFVPFESAKVNFSDRETNIPINIQVFKPEDIALAEAASIGLIRSIRGLGIKKENDFIIEKSDGLVSDLKENTSKLRLSAVAIGLITLLGAAIGLMNIMLVSVTERTREIGIMKAIGATQKSIMFQFLTEAMVICQMGGIVGILLGVGMGFLISLALGGKFLIPWAWIIAGIVTCLIVGIAAGFYPARKAALLDPVEALRYE